MRLQQILWGINAFDGLNYISSENTELLEIKKDTERLHFSSNHREGKAYCVYVGDSAKSSLETIKKLSPLREHDFR